MASTIIPIDAAYVTSLITAIEVNHASIVVTMSDNVSLGYNQEERYISAWRLSNALFYLQRADTTITGENFFIQLTKEDASERKIINEFDIASPYS